MRGTVNPNIGTREGRGVKSKAMNKLLKGTSRRARNRRKQTKNRRNQNRQNIIRADKIQREIDKMNAEFRLREKLKEEGIKSMKHKIKEDKEMEPEPMDQDDFIPEEEIKIKHILICGHGSLLQCNSTGKIIKSIVSEVEVLMKVDTSNILSTLFLSIDKILSCFLKPAI